MKDSGLKNEWYSQESSLSVFNCLRYRRYIEMSHLPQELLDLIRDGESITVEFKK